jgi:hypothetical protein
MDDPWSGISSRVARKSGRSESPEARNAENQHSTRQDPIDKYTTHGAPRGEQQRERSAVAVRLACLQGAEDWRNSEDAPATKRIARKHWAIQKGLVAGARNRHYLQLWRVDGSSAVMSHQPDGFLPNNDADRRAPVVEIALAEIERI